MSWFKHRPNPKESIPYPPNRNTPIGRQLKEQQKEKEKKDGK